jgi:hypothetical protein
VLRPWLAAPKLHNTAVQIPDVGLGQDDALCERCGVTVDGFLRGILASLAGLGLEC